ncbi:MAG TPA: tetratricopeptide repeat protein [Alphaproteobacteria bacterium]|nr:tetratricopeptide repeat protein [Alphaproteobacteria bacterium]
MNIICFVLLIFTSLTVTETYAMNPGEYEPDSEAISIASALNQSEENDEGKHDLLYEINVFMIKSCRYCFPKLSKSNAEYIIPVCRKVLEDPSNTLEQIANIYVYRGAAWHQLGSYYEALKDFETAYNMKYSNGRHILIEEPLAQVVSHIGIIAEEVGMIEEAASIYELVLEMKTRTGFALPHSERTDIDSRLLKIREMENRNTTTTLPELPYYPALEKMKIDNLLDSKKAEEGMSLEKMKIDNLLNSKIAEEGTPLEKMKIDNLFDSKQAEEGTSLEKMKIDNLLNRMDSEKETLVESMRIINSTVRKSFPCLGNS